MSILRPWALAAVLSFMTAVPSFARTPTFAAAQAAQGQRTYAQTCARKKCSIWSLTVENSSGDVRRLQTVEVNRHRVIVQSRGKRNDLPAEPELRVLDRWAHEAGLEGSSYLSAI